MIEGLNDTFLPELKPDVLQQEWCDKVFYELFLKTFRIIFVTNENCLFFFKSIEAALD